ncbi:MAG: thioredoxin [Clostridia bacterium]|nr:thioredoxin [Clostridia bacterium]
MVKKINAEEFVNEAEKSAVAIVDFSATWCGPCRMMAPVLEELSEEMSGKADFYNLDVDEAPEVAAKFGISSIPCLVLLKNGQAVSQSVGFRPGPQIKAWIEGNL